MTNQEFHKKICKAALSFYPSNDDLSGTTLIDTQFTIISTLKGQCEMIQCLSASDGFTDEIRLSAVYSFVESILRQIEIMYVVNDKLSSELFNLKKIAGR